MNTTFLTSIWERALGISHIRAEDNFFDLGGNASSADNVFAEIKNHGGRELPSELICIAPTIASLARLLTEQETAPFAGPLLLKPGAEGLPIFVIHGMGGSVLEVAPIARRIQTNRPVYALQAKGIGGLERPFRRVEEFTLSYSRAIQNLQPSGPYSLIGYSFGGLIALDLAMNLWETGKQISLLVMLDSYPANPHLPLPIRVRELLRRCGDRALTFFNPKGPVISGSALVPEVEPTLEYSSPGREQVRASSYDAWYHYRPRRYEGTVHFIQAAVKWVFPADPASVWGHFIRDLKLFRIACNHLEMTTSHAGEVATKLSEYLQAPETYAEQRALRVCSGT